MTGSGLVVQDRMTAELLDLWKDLVGDQVMCQIERTLRNGPSQVGVAT